MQAVFTMCSMQLFQTFSQLKQLVKLNRSELLLFRNSVYKTLVKYNTFKKLLYFSKITYHQRQRNVQNFKLIIGPPFPFGILIAIVVDRKRS